VLLGLVLIFKEFDHLISKNESVNQLVSKKVSSQLQEHKKTVEFNYQ